MSTVQLIVVLLFHLGTLKSSIFNCDSNSLCSSLNTCPSNESCLVVCDRNHICENYSYIGQSQLSNINIYAVQSYNDIYVQCKHRNCYDSSRFPSIYCSDHSPSCDIEIQSTQSNQSNEYNIWQCTANTAFSICNSISFPNDTFITANVTMETTDLWTNILDNIEAVENDSNDMAVVIGGVLGAITCCLFFVICVIGTYFKLNMTKTTSTKSIVVIDINKNKELERLGSKSETSVRSVTSPTTDSNSRFINKRRASNLPKPKPRNSHHKMKQHAKRKQIYVITPTPDSLKNDMSDVDMCDFST